MGSVKPGRAAQPEAGTVSTGLEHARRLTAPAPAGYSKLWCFTMHREFQKETEKSIWQLPPVLPPHCPAVEVLKELMEKDLS